MIESMLVKRKVQVQSPYLVDINFERATVGDQFVIDRGNLALPMPRGVWNGNGGDGVVDVPTLGKCYYFNGNVRFGDTLNAIPLAGTNFEIVVKFRDALGNTSAVFATGDYHNTAGIKAGRELIINQASDNYIQLFSTDQFGTYQRQYVGGVNLLTNEEITITSLVGGNTTLFSKRTGKSSILPTFNTGKDSYLLLGTTHALANAFRGYLKSLTIRAL